MTQTNMTRALFENRLQGLEDHNEWPEFADFVRALLDLPGAELAVEAFKRIEQEHGSAGSLGMPRRLRAGDVRAVLAANEEAE
jgi:hypothetical protein